MDAPTASPRTAVFVVTFNAASTIGAVLRRIQPRTWERISEVFVFDDHSADDTALVASREKPPEHADRIRVFHNQINLGYGGNQKRGYLYAMQREFDVVVLLHGDGQYAPEVMDDLLDPILRGEADAVLGSRMLEPGKALSGGMPLYKYIGNRILTVFQNFVLGRRLSEYHSGYRAYSMRALRALPFLRNSNEFHFDNEIIVQLHESGHRIAEVPIPTYYSDEIRQVKGLGYAWDVVKTSLTYRLHKAGLAYSPRFDLRGGRKYVFKPSRFSSHQRILELAGAERPLDVLDLGCGGGVLARPLRDKGHRVVGVDVYDSEEARAHCDRFIVRDLERDLGLGAEEQFDLIILADILEHTRKPEEILLRAASHLRRGGRLIASTGNVANLYVRIALLLGFFSYTERGILDSTHCRLFTPASFGRLFRDCGFRIRRRRACPIPFEAVLPSWPWLSRFLGAAYMIGVWLLPSLFAYQCVLEVEAAPGPSELLRALEIQRAEYVEWSPKAEGQSPSGPNPGAGQQT
jgi:glycosyltransferase involved in cell wall biosynthesis